MPRIKYWPFVLIVTGIIVFALGWGGADLRFPLALGVLRVAFFVTEQVWPRVRA